MNKLKNYRENAKLSQTELSERTGIDQAAISRAENGASDLKGQHWKLIANVFNCTVDELLN